MVSRELFGPRLNLSMLTTIDCSGLRGYSEAVSFRHHAHDQFLSLRTCHAATQKFRRRFGLTAAVSLSHIFDFFFFFFYEETHKLRGVWSSFRVLRYTSNVSPTGRNMGSRWGGSWYVRLFFPLPSDDVRRCLLSAGFRVAPARSEGPKWIERGVFDGCMGISSSCFGVPPGVPSVVR